MSVSCKFTAQESDQAAEWVINYLTQCPRLPRRPCQMRVFGPRKCVMIWFKSSRSIKCSDVGSNYQKGLKTSFANGSDSHEKTCQMRVLGPRKV